MTLISLFSLENAKSFNKSSDLILFIAESAELRLDDSFAILFKTFSSLIFLIANWPISSLSDLTAIFPSNSSRLVSSPIIISSDKLKSLFKAFLDTIKSLSSVTILTKSIGELIYLIASLRTKLSSSVLDMVINVFSSFILLKVSILTNLSLSFNAI